MNFNEESNENYVLSYQKVTDKLKRKRFLRKPNYAEALPDYAKLASQLRREGAQRFAAFCCIAVARCQEAQRNFPSQAIELQNAGDLFWNLALDEGNVDITDFEENTEQAIHSFKLAINIYLSLKKYGMASSLYYEMATGLKYLKRYKEAAVEFRKAAEIQQTESSIVAINSLMESFACSIEYGGFQDGFQDLQWIIKLSTEEAHENQSQFFLDKKVDAFVSLVLVLLMMRDIEQARLTLILLRREHNLHHKKHTQPHVRPKQQNPQQNQPQKQQILLPVDIFSTSEWFFELMEEVVTSFEENDEYSLSQIHAELSETFSPIQNRLFLMVIQNAAPMM